MRTILAILALLLVGCATGPDYSPEVVTHAASYSGGAPQFDSRGRMMGVSSTGNSSNNRRTMFTE